MITEKMLIEQCSPTLSGLKTASLFTIKTFTDENLSFSLKFWNRKFKPKGLKLIVLKQRDNFALLYLYREAKLKKDFENLTSSKIMDRYGYHGMCVEKKLERLKNRFIDYSEFPHEIGLFLGYPPKDVEGFICNKGQNCNLCGYWKVYGDTKEAMIKFAKYDKCKNIYKKLWEEGRDIMRLIVA